MNENDIFHWIMSGETFQQMCHMYLGEMQDFMYNPKISMNDKNKILSSICEPFDNPSLLFCYSHRLQELAGKLQHFQKPFILVSGNSDENIIDCHKFRNIADHHMVVKWYAQNLNWHHPKIHPLPIGIANSQWSHGNKAALLYIRQQMPKKSDGVYFNFGFTSQERIVCYKKLKDTFPFLQNLPPLENFLRLCKYKFCICPEGNGFDTHRLWECYYLNVVPIVLNTKFIQVLKAHLDIPMVILEDWNELRDIASKLDYNVFKASFSPVKDVAKNILEDLAALEHSMSCCD